MALRNGLTLAGFLLVAAAFGQPATPAQMAGVKPAPGYGTMHFQTRLGGFRSIDGRGRLEFTFTGTVLLSQVKGDAKVTGQVRKEWDKNDRRVYTGTGRVVVTGEWRAVQWFGRDMQGVWYGRGTLRMGGEFDRDLNTGTYWFDDPNDKMYWPAGTTFDISFPRNMPGVNPATTPRKKK
ncbi:MAG: hypothetical protein KIT11_03080 [Fimbriimonadaceae bacterium]|nr:hypothetical protein [Fimbriimonadaceae bacterium]QYK57119.1 MAG: hypothetical protein KF733_06445 [Fimbriimonadaceae bacterium]